MRRWRRRLKAKAEAAFKTRLLSAREPSTKLALENVLMFAEDIKSATEEGLTQP